MNYLNVIRELIELCNTNSHLKRDYSRSILSVVARMSLDGLYVSAMKQGDDSFIELRHNNDVLKLKIRQNKGKKLDSKWDIKETERIPDDGKQCRAVNKAIDAHRSVLAGVVKERKGKKVKKK